MEIANENPSVLPPPLDLDLDTVDTSRPLIAHGELVTLQFDKVEPLMSKPKAGQTPVPMVKITCKVVSPTKNIKGEPIEAGRVSLIHNIMLAPAGKATWEMLAQNIAQVTQPNLPGMKLGEFLNGGYMQLQGRSCPAKINYVPEGPDKSGVQRSAKNEIAAFLKN